METMIVLYLITARMKKIDCARNSHRGRYAPTFKWAVADGMEYKRNGEIHNKCHNKSYYEEHNAILAGTRLLLFY